MPYPRLHTVWKVSVIYLSIQWAYGRVATRTETGEIKEVRLTLDPHTRLRDYVLKQATATVCYYETYQEAVEFLQACLLEEAKAISQLWKKSRQQEHGRSILKLTRI